MLISPGTIPHYFTFDSEYRRNLLERSVNWHIPGLSEFTFIRTYARRKENNKLETWNECTVRVIEGMFSILKTYAKLSHITWDQGKAQRLAQEAADRMFVFKWLPPGRGLWIMGTDFMWQRGSAALNNPLGLDTRVYTKEYGFIEIGKLQQDEKVTVVSRDLQTFANVAYATAITGPVMEQAVIEISYRTAFNTERKIISSKNHRWWRKKTTKDSFERVTAEELKIGDWLPRTTQPRFYTPCPIGIMHGYFFGDGTRSNGEIHQFTEDNVDVLNRYFTFVEEAGRTLASGLKDMCVRHLPKAWAFIPKDEYISDQKYVLGFLMGYFAADGTICNSNGQLSISSSKKEEIIQIEKLFEMIGIETKITEDSHASNYSDERELYKMYINRHDVDETFFVKKNHANSFEYSKKKYHHHRITNIEYLGIKQVRCLTVPGYENFMVEGFLTTANCSYISTELIGTSRDETTLPFRFLMDMSMLGVGVGFDTKGAQNNIPVLGYANASEDFIVEDSREGWVDLIAKVIENGIYGGPRIISDTHKVREAGLPIRGFGGVSSGPEPLIKCAVGIADILSQRADCVDNRLATTDIVDIQNMIGKCVVAGNVRRSAEIAFAEPDDKAFFTMKNWSENAVAMGARAPDELKAISPEDYYTYNDNLWDTRNNVARMIVKKYQSYPWSYKFGGWRWASNNSLFAQIGMDYRKYEEAINNAGEPGFIWLELAQRFGRLRDPENNLDREAKGANPCIEQTLFSGELCCLVENFPFYHNDYWDFQRTLKFSYLYAKTVTLMATHFARTNSIIIRNRRIGCSLSGIADAISKFGRTTIMQQFCDRGYQYIQYIDKKYSNWLGIPQSIKKTSVKPSGTVSLVAGVAGPGVHFAKMRSGYRLIRVATNSDLVPLLRTANYRVEPSVSDPLNTIVVYFPWISPDSIITEDESTIWEKFKMAADLQYWWADNQVSCTVEFTKDEANDHQISRCLEAFDGQLKGISLLPKTSGIYPQMPYTPAPYEEILAYQAQLKALNFSELTTEGDNLEANKYCDSTGCEV